MNRHESNEKKEKYVNVLHLIYGGIIALIVLISIIICQPRAVHPEATNNFAFAATITSIVLAVVSIVYSIQSGSGVSSNLGSIKSIENSINTQLEKINSLEERITSNISHKIEDSNAEVCSRLDGMEKNNAERQPQNAGQAVSSGEFDTNKTSILGKIALYACYKAFVKQMKIELKYCFEEHDVEYVYGYLVGIASVCYDNIKLVVENQCIDVLKFNKDYFYNVDTLPDDDSDTFRTFSKMVKKIDDYFSKLEENEGAV